MDAQINFNTIYYIIHAKSKHIVKFKMFLSRSKIYTLKQPPDVFYKNRFS